MRRYSTCPNSLGRCPNCQTTWGMRHKLSAVELFRSYAESVSREAQQRTGEK